MRIETAEGVPEAELRGAMLAAFSDYAVPMQPSPEVFALMMRQRGLDRTASRVARGADGIAAIWLVGLRGTAAYLIASGTLPVHRGRGLARRLAAASAEALRARGAETLRTEVMEGNAVAAGLYARLGLSEMRRLDCHGVSPAAGEAVPMAWSGARKALAAWRDWPPTWQNDDASLGAIEDEVRAIGMQEAGEPVAVGAVVPRTGTLAQIAVRPDRRRRGLGTALLRAAGTLVPDGRLRLINADAGDAGFAAFLRANGAERTTGQRELAGPLR